MISFVTKRMWRLLVLAAAVTTAAIAIEAKSADGALFFLFEPASARSGDRVVIRTGGTPRSFALADRTQPPQGSIALYLVRNELADTVRSRDDPRLVSIGSLAYDRNGRGLLPFRVPDLKPGAYAAAAYCPACARFSRGRAFLSWRVDERDVLPRYRHLVLLRVVPPGSSSWRWPLAGGVTAFALAVLARMVVLQRRTKRGASVSE